MRVNINLFKDLVLNDFKSRYASSTFGAFWAYVLPLVNLIVMWYVFQVGLRNGNIDNVPFIVWFAPASLAWTFCAETLSSTTSCLKEYGYLVSKVSFNITTIPIIKVISNSIVHIFFLFFLLLLNKYYGIHLTVYNLQIFYYFICMFFFLIGVGFIVSSMYLFFSDIQSLVNIIIQIGFWITPIVWNVNDMSIDTQTIVKLNPMYYIVMGYRDSLFNNVWFWDKPWLTIYYWTITLCTVFFGYKLFCKLKPQFADLL